MDFKGKKALIMGLANQRSLAYGVAKALRAQGAELGFTYIDVIEDKMRPLAEELGASFITKCDVSLDSDIQNLKAVISTTWGDTCDALVHSLAFAEREDLEREFVFTSRQGFLKAIDISAYSLVGVTGALLPALERAKGSVITFSYLGAERVVQNYNVMGIAKAALEASVRYLASDCGPRGIRVNAISAGPVRTLAASGVKDFRSILTQIEQRAPLRRNISIDDVGETAAFLLSDRARGITGEVIYVDSGYQVLG